MSTPPRPTRKAVFPDGRLGVRDFCARAGISYTEFYARYRFDETYQQRWDIRVDAKGRLNLSASAADAQAHISAGNAIVGFAGRFLRKPCPRCAAENHVRRKTCRACGHPTFVQADTEPHGGANAATD